MAVFGQYVEIKTKDENEHFENEIEIVWQFSFFDRLICKLLFNEGCFKILKHIYISFFGPASTRSYKIGVVGNWLVGNAVFSETTL